MFLKSYTFWFKTTAVFQLLTAAVHSLSFIVDQTPSNEQEKQLLDLMGNYHLNLGAGFTPTTDNLMTAFSISFTLLFIFGGVLNFYLIAKKLDVQIIKGIVVINIIIFGACFVAVLLLTFLPPIICLGLIFGSLLLTFLTIPKIKHIGT